MTLRKALVQVRVPADLHFSALRLRRHPDGDLSFDGAVLARVLAESGIPEAAATEDLHSGIISGWYRMHRDGGGERDPVMEELIREEEREQHDRAN